MHRRLNSATLSQLAFPGESNTNFSWEKFQWENTVVKKSWDFVFLYRQSAHVNWLATIRYIVGYDRALKWLFYSLQTSDNSPAENVLERIRNYTNQLPNTSEVSVVTAYFNLGNLSKRTHEGDLFSVHYGTTQSIEAARHNILTDKRNAIKTQCNFNGTFTHFIFKCLSSPNFLEFGWVILIQCAFVFKHQNFHASKERMSGMGIPCCSRGLELIPKVRDGGRIHVQSNGCHMWRVSGRQSPNGPFTFSGCKSWHHGFQSMGTASKRTSISEACWTVFTPKLWMPG